MDSTSPPPLCRYKETLGCKDEFLERMSTSNCRNITNFKPLAKQRPIKNKTSSTKQRLRHVHQKTNSASNTTINSTKDKKSFTSQIKQQLKSECSRFDTACASAIGNVLFNVMNKENSNMSNSNPNRSHFDSNQNNLDYLTGLPNRQELDTKMKQICNSISTQDNSNKSENWFLLCIDIDKFKTINDKYGHICGDFLLQNIANAMKKITNDHNKNDNHNNNSNTTNTKQSLNFDINSSWSSNISCYRRSGDEFVILLNPENDINTNSSSDGTTHSTDQSILSQKKACNVAELLRSITEGSCSTTISIGLTNRVQNETSMQWLNRCDNLLYQAKNKGGNCVVSD